jgi:hypothetical protein
LFLKFFRRKSAPDSAGATHGSGLVNGIDREMYYCPTCGDEYRPGIARCVSCAVPLVSGHEKLEQLAREQENLARRSMELSPEDELVNIRKGTLNDMKYLRKVLTEERIPSLIAGDGPGCGRGCGGPEMFLQIKEKDVDAALAILAKDFIKSTALDSHDLSNAQAVFDHQAAETQCPACGCRFSPTVGACPECGLSFE